MLWQKFGFIALLLAGVSACTSDYDLEDVYYDGDDVAMCENGECSDYFAVPMIEEDGDQETLYVAKNTKPVAQKQVTNDGALSGDNLPLFNAAGVRYCPPKMRCSGDLLPPQPCAQPMPKYYDNISADAAADAVELIHPFTRTKVLCYDQLPIGTAADCANIFRADGYVLVTDIPQLPAKYDLLKEGMYPGRRWRGGGEVVPRW